MIALESGTQALNHLILPTLLKGREALLSLFGKHIDKRVDLCFQPKLGKLVPVISGILITWNSHDTHLIQCQVQECFRSLAKQELTSLEELWSSYSRISIQENCCQQSFSNSTLGNTWLAQKYTWQEGRMTREGKHKQKDEPSSLWASLSQISKQKMRLSRGLEQYIPD